MPRIIPTIAEIFRRRKRTEAERADDNAALVAAYHATFTTPDGREVFADLLRRSGYFLANGDERSAGMRDMGIFLVRMMRTDAADMARFAVTTEVGDLFNE